MNTDTTTTAALASARRNRSAGRDLAGIGAIIILAAIGYVLFPDNLALLNKYVVRGAQPTGNGTWAGNVTFNGNSYAGTMKLVSKNFMTLKGCSGILCQTYEFTRI